MSIFRIARFTLCSPSQLYRFNNAVKAVGLLCLAAPGRLYDSGVGGLGVFCPSFSYIFQTAEVDK